MEYVLMLLSVLVACGGIWLAYRWYIQRPEVPGKIAEASPVPLQAALQQVLRGPAIRRDVRESCERSGANARRVRCQLHQRAWSGRLRLGDANYVAHFRRVGFLDRGRPGESSRANRLAVQLAGAHAANGARARYALFMLLGVLIFLGYYLWTSGFRL